MKAKTLLSVTINESIIRTTNHKSPTTSLIGKASQCKEAHLETDVLKKWLALDLSRLKVAGGEMRMVFGNEISGYFSIL